MLKETKEEVKIMMNKTMKSMLMLVLLFAMVLIAIPSSVAAKERMHVQTAQGVNVAVAEIEAGNAADSTIEADNTIPNLGEKNEEVVEIEAQPLPVIKIKKDTLSVKKGRTAKITFTYDNCKKKDIIWKSSKKSVVTVDNKGRIKGKGGGTAIITARVKGTNIKDTIKVTCINYYTMRVRTTGYCNCRSCVGGWAGGRTASGKMPRANHTIAVDTRRIRLGTKIRIGNITYVAEDTGGAIKGNNMDIYYSSHSKAQAHGVKYQTAKIYY